MQDHLAKNTGRIQLLLPKGCFILIFYSVWTFNINFNTQVLYDRVFKFSLKEFQPGESQSHALLLTSVVTSAQFRKFGPPHQVKNHDQLRSLVKEKGIQNGQLEIPVTTTQSVIEMSTVIIMSISSLIVTCLCLCTYIHNVTYEVLTVYHGIQVIGYHGEQQTSFKDFGSSSWGNSTFQVVCRIVALCFVDV